MILVITNLPFDEWAEALGSERLTGVLLDRLTHHVRILEMNGESYRLRQRQAGRRIALFGLTSDLNPQQIRADIFAERLGLGGTVFRRPGGPTCRRP